MRPQIRPAIFVALQNGLAALLFAALICAETTRRLLDSYPQSEVLWRLSMLANRSVLPVLQYAGQYLTTPDKLMWGLVAGVAIPLLAWWTRYWFATAIAGHLSLAALLIIAYTAYNRGSLALAALNPPDQLDELGAAMAACVLVGLIILLVIMCIADHVAFIRHLVWLWKRLRHRA